MGRGLSLAKVSIHEVWKYINKQFFSLLIKHVQNKNSASDSSHILFSQKGLCCNFGILDRVNNHKKIKIWVGGGGIYPLEIDFFYFFMQAY